MEQDKLTSNQLDLLREIGNIGAGNATTALSVILNSNLRMEMPVVKILEFNEIPEMVGGAGNVVTAILTHYTGEVSGMALFILELAEAKNLVSAIIGKENFSDSSRFTRMEESALKEIGNILLGSYISSISTLTNFQIAMNPPAISVDMAGAVLSLPIIELGQVGDKALVIDSKFLDNERPINGFLMLVSDETSFNRIFESLGIRG